MIVIICKICGKAREVPLPPLRCCGTVYYSADANSDDPRWVPGSLCSHRGESTRVVECKACKGTVKLKVFACDVHGECTLKKNVGLHVCLGCDDWQAT